MTTTNRSSQPNLVIKGSWQDLLARAHRAAANQNEEAIQHYLKVRDGLRRLPAEQLAAQNGRLQKLLETAAVNLHIFLTERQRYDDALDALTQVLEFVPAEDVSGWQLRRAMVLQQAERNDEAVQVLRGLITSDEVKPTDWGNLVMHHTRRKEFDQAAAVLAEMEAWYQQHPPSGDDQPQREEVAAYVTNLRSIMSLAAGEYEAAVTWFERTIELDQDFLNHLDMLYARLLFYKQPELALPWIQRDRKRPMRAGFYHGLALRQMGKAEEAVRRWEQVVKSINEKTNNQEFFEIILTYFYLGDPEGTGLGAVLRVLQSDEKKSWIILTLAALGWMLRGNVQSARTDLAQALIRRRAAAEGALLSPELWQFFEDLLSPEAQQQVIEYFNTER
jgi:tetratricopeptide (TPR) repeat protein